LLRKTSEIRIVHRPVELSSFRPAGTVLPPNCRRL